MRWRYGHTLTHGLAVFSTPQVGSPEHIIGVLGDGEDAIQNAALIASAPDMRETLESIFLKCSVEHVHDWHQFRREIAEKIGQTLKKIE